VSTAIPASPVAPPSVTAPSSRGFTELATLPEVRFRPGQVTLSRADLPTLERVVRWLKEHPEAEVLIEGHTDDLGTDEGNRIVGEKRAATIMQHLVAKGVEPDRISIVSLGSERPRCGEKTDACRAQNRRARVLVKQP
jgi:peptidoglycan-associated lipoprotein